MLLVKTDKDINKNIETVEFNLEESEDSTDRIEISFALLSVVMFLSATKLTTNFISFLHVLLDIKIIPSSSIKGMKAKMVGLPIKH